MLLKPSMVASSLVMAVASASAAPDPAPDPGLQSDSSFRTAIADRSTSPFFVRIVLVDPADGTARVLCTEGNRLMSAIHREFDLPDDPSGQARATRIALAAPNHSFRFTKPAALSFLAIRPVDEERNAQACEAIAGGASVRRADLTDQLEFVR